MAMVFLLLPRSVARTGLLLPGSSRLKVPAAPSDRMPGGGRRWSSTAGPSGLEERTLIALKPDGVQRRLLGDVIKRFERRGFKLVGLKLLQANEGILSEHYHELRRKPFYHELIQYMTSGPVVAMVWEGHNVVKTSRSMVGDTNPVEAKPGTVRGDFSVHISRNVVHASDSVETAQREINLWFRSDELVAWDCCDHRIISFFSWSAEEAMAQSGSACQPPPDVETDDCLHEYCYLFNPDILKGKVAFVTGGGSGIGFRIAEILMRHGCQTAVASRNLQRVTEAAKKLSAATGQRCLPLTLDVRQPQAIMAAVDEALKEFQRIDILINNAAGNFLCPASSLSFNGYKTVIEIDTMGTFNVSKVLYEKCFREHGGVIVNISATLSYRGQALQVHAGTAKAAIEAMTKHLAVEWGPNGIRVNSLAPGPIAGTEGMRRLAPKAEETNLYQNIPLQRAGTKTEVAHGVLYLASPLSSYVTGTTLVVDGGAWMTSENSFPALLDYWSTELKKEK